MRPGALSVSHSKFSFPTFVPTTLPFAPCSVSSLAAMKFLRVPFLRDRRPSWPTWRTSAGSVRANLADQTEAKSHAFVRVNSIHRLSLPPPARSSSLSSLLALLSLRSLPLSRSRLSTSSTLLQPSSLAPPHHPRPFQSMSSRQRPFRYFYKATGRPLGGWPPDRYPRGILSDLAERVV